MGQQALLCSAAVLFLAQTRVAQQPQPAPTAHDTCLPASPTAAPAPAPGTTWPRGRTSLSAASTNSLAPSRPQGCTQGALTRACEAIRDSMPLSRNCTGGRGVCAMPACVGGQPTGKASWQSKVCSPHHPFNRTNLLAQYGHRHDVHGARQQDAGALNAHRGLGGRRPRRPGSGCGPAAGGTTCVSGGSLGLRCWLLRWLLLSLRWRRSIVCCLGRHADHAPASGPTRERCWRQRRQPAAAAAAAAALRSRQQVGWGHCASQTPRIDRTSSLNRPAALGKAGAAARAARGAPLRASSAGRPISAQWGSADTALTQHGAWGSLPPRAFATACSGRGLASPPRHLISRPRRPITHLSIVGAALGPGGVEQTCSEPCPNSPRAAPIAG